MINSTPPTADRQRRPHDRDGYAIGIRLLIDSAEARGASDGEIRRLIRRYQCVAIRRVYAEIGGQR
jgi:hypothetical protein